MSEASANPNYVYKIVPSSSPVPDKADLPERLPISDIDRKSGFIHLSTSKQIAGTLKGFFNDDDFVYILRMKYDDLEGQIRWEDPESKVCGPRPGEGLFPHLHNGLKLGKDEVELVKTLKNSEEGGWVAAIEKAKVEWLV